MNIEYRQSFFSYIRVCVWSLWQNLWDRFALKYLRTCCKMMNIVQSENV